MMAEDWIEQQIIAIRNATKKAMVSKEVAIRLLEGTGIILKEKKVKRKKKKK